MPDNPLTFHSARSVAETEPEETDYKVEQLLIKGAITAFSAKIKAGKTTFLGHLMRAMLNNEPIIDLLTRPAKILYCTEEGKKTFRAFLKRTGLEETEDIQVLFLGSVPREIAWEYVAQYVLAYALSINADVIIFDTLTRWARIPADKENDPGTAAEAMVPLERIRDSNLAVMAVFHDRKSGGEVGESQRGSSAFGGAADIILQLENKHTNSHPNRRYLSQLGRFDDPGLWAIDLREGSYYLVGEDEGLQVERKSFKLRILETLASEATLNKNELSLDLMVDSNNSTLDRALKELVRDGEVVASGRGVRGDPTGYSIPPKTILTSRES